MTDVMARVQKHYDRAVEHYGANAVLGVFLYGSWNYNTNTPDSDVDTKCILIPNLHSLAIKPYETKHLSIDDEVCECMTIMHMVANWKKQNVNFVEIMFTDYCIINPLYKDLWEKLLPAELRERVARYDLRQTIHFMAHQAIHTLKQNPEDPKKVMNGVRIANTISRVVSTDLPYRECIWMDEKVRENRFRTPDPKLVESLVLIFEDYLVCVDDYKAEKYEQVRVDLSLETLILKLIEYRITELW